MAHADCIGLWEHGKLGTASDGDIEIKMVGSTLVGTYLKDGTPLDNIKCEGDNPSFLSFSRVDAQTGETVSYIRGKIKKVSATKSELKGKFKKAPKQPVNAKARAKKAAALLPDDWEADKTT